MSIMTGIARREGAEAATLNLVTAIASKMGELCGAARRDWVDADAAEVGLHGVPIKQWRNAYFEGCRDMAEAVASALPEDRRDSAKEIVRDAFDRALKAPR